MEDYYPVHKVRNLEVRTRDQVWFNRAEGGKLFIQSWTISE